MLLGFPQFTLVLNAYTQACTCEYLGLPLREHPDVPSSINHHLLALLH